MRDEDHGKATKQTHRRGEEERRVGYLERCYFLEKITLIQRITNEIEAPIHLQQDRRFIKQQ
jgi:hypothetical protein